MEAAQPLTARGLLRVKLPVIGFVALLGLVAFVAFLFGLIEHHSCTTAPSEVSKPEPGSARYVWCHHHAYLYPWTLTLAPVAAVAAVGLIVRLRAVITVAVAVLVLLVALTFASHPSGLNVLTYPNI